MNDGIFRDQPKICGLCQLPVGNDISTINYSKDRKATFHQGCWMPLDEAYKTTIRQAIANDKREKEMRWEKIWDGFCEWIGRCVAVALVGGVTLLLGWVIYSAISASDKVEFCQVQSTGSNQLELIGVVYWAQDKNFGTYPDMNSALDAAQKYGCEVK